MKIVADENIPLVQELFGSLGDVVVLPGRQISAADVRDAEVLLVRSVTQVNRELLEASSVKFVGTCTIGTDHLDQNYLNSSGITYSSAPGCNAKGVVQYVFAALAQLQRLDTQLKIGIVGCGNVGGRLYLALKKAGHTCVCYDPFLSKQDIEDIGEWNDLFDCDVVCTHTPLTIDGPYPTHHMMSTDFFQQMKPGALLLNAGRGAAIDNQALLHYLRGGNTNDLRIVLDVWEPEPNLDTALLEFVSLGSPHIAGYSYEGRTNGSLMIYEALSRWLGLPDSDTDETIVKAKAKTYGEPIALKADSLREAILKTYPILEDDINLRAVKNSLSKEFDLLRKNYPQRREFSHYTILDPATEFVSQYQALGFNVQMTA